MRTPSLLAVLGLAACTYPEKQFQDRFACLGAPEPTGAQPLVTLTGTTFDPQTGMRFGGATMLLQNRTLATIDGPITSSPSGGFGFSPLNTNSTAVDNDNVYINGTASGRISTYFTPPRPITDDVVIEFSMLTTMQRDIMAGSALGMPFTVGTGVVLLEIKDCNGDPIENATLASSAAGPVRYFEGIFPSMTTTATDVSGVALVANLTQDSTTLTATVDGVTLPARTVTVVPDAITRTVILP